METIALFVLVLLSVIGFAAVFFTTFGTLIILAGSLIYSLMTGFTVLDLSSLLILLTLYCAGEVSEYFCIIFGAKKSGASNAAVAGALAGGIAGALLGLLLPAAGILAGTVLGIFFGAFFVEYFIRRDLKRSLKAGAGSVLGRLGSVLIKIFIAVAMLTVIGLRIIRGG